MTCSRPVRGGFTPRCLVPVVTYPDGMVEHDALVGQLLDKQWRLLAPIEGLTGILMCGLSAAFFFAVVIGIDQARHPKTT